MTQTDGNPIQLLKPSPANLRTLLKKGYTLRELIYWGVRLKIHSRIKTAILYSFFAKGNCDIDHTVVIQGSRFIALGSQIYIQRNSWLTVPLFDMKTIERRPYIKIGDGVRMGPGCMISAGNSIELENDVLLGPNVTITDHRHEYSDRNVPISKQGMSGKGTIRVEQNSWIGANAVISCSDSGLVIGRGSVIAANSMVRESVPEFSLVAGNPARVVRHL